METSINIVSTLDGKKKQKSLTNINPSATNEELSAVGQMINALSKNDYVETIRINKQNVLEPAPSGGKAEPTFIINNDGSYEYNGDGEIFGYIEGDHLLAIDRTYKTFYVDFLPPEQPDPMMSYTVTLYASEGTNYAAKSVTYVHNGS